MPFTFSHPAIILPISFLPRKMYSFTGLVVGSMMPDFEYFLRLRQNSYFSHTWPALFYFNLPLGLLLAWAFHLFVRDALIDNLPSFLRQHLLPFKKQQWTVYLKEHWLTVGVSILIGAASHIFWDSFTREEGYFVGLFPLLKTKLIIGKVIFPGYRVVQHLSTLVGGVCIWYAIMLQPKQMEEPSYARLATSTYWLVVMGVALLVVLFRFMSDLHYNSYSHIISAFIGGGLGGLVLASVLYQKSRQKALWP